MQLAGASLCEDGCVILRAALGARLMTVGRGPTSGRRTSNFSPLRETWPAARCSCS